MNCKKIVWEEIHVEANLCQPEVFLEQFAVPSPVFPLKRVLATNTYWFKKHPHYHPRFYVPHYVIKRSLEETKDLHVALPGSITRNM